MASVTDRFLPPTDFDGDDGNRPAGGLRLGGGSAIFNGQIAFANVNRVDAQALLPKNAGIKLATHMGDYPTVHPVLHLHGKQTQTAWVVNGDRLPIGNDYGEFMLLIPFVHLGSSSQWFNFVVRMYLNDPGAVLLGKDFGYRKQGAFVDVLAGSFDVRLLDPFNPFVPRPAFHADHAPNTSASAAQLPHWPSMEAILSMPILGVDEFTGMRLCSYFRLDFKAATIDPIDCTDSYKPAFDPATSALPMTNVQDGAVDVAGVDWQIDFPAIIL